MIDWTRWVNEVYVPVLECDGCDEEEGAEDPGGEEHGEAGDGDAGRALQRRRVGQHLVAVCYQEGASLSASFELQFQGYSDYRFVWWLFCNVVT